MKKALATGIVILLPVILTVIFLSFLLNLLTNPFQGLITSFFTALGIGHPTGTVLFLSRLIILALIGMLILCIGKIGQYYLVKYFLRTGESIIRQIPLVNKIYVSTKEVMKTIFSSESQSFSQVVMAPFPYSGSYCLGFITNDQLIQSSLAMPNELVSVFVPGTPNPTVGFVLLFPKKDLVFLDTKVEDALKFILSCGIMHPPAFSRIQMSAD